jgi:phosphomannomutase/phosphoglucomutase
MVKKTTDTEATPDKGTAGNGSTGQERSGKGGVFRYTLITVLGSIVAIILSSMTFQTQVLDAAQRESGDRLARAYATQYANYFNQVFAQAMRQLESASTQLDLANVIGSGDDAQMQAQARIIAASLGRRSEVFILGRQSSLTQLTLGFAAQDMASRVLRNEPVPPEIIPLKERPLLLVASPIRDAASATVGVLLVGFDLVDIGANLKYFDTNAGLLVLEQALGEGEAPMVVLQNGSEALRDNSPYVDAAQTSSQRFTVRFWLNPQLVTTSLGALLWGVAVGAMVFVLLSILATSLLTTRAIKRNASMLLQFAESLVKRVPPPAGIHFDMDLFEDVALSLRRTARAVGNGGKAVAGTELPFDQIAATPRATAGRATASAEATAAVEAPAAVDAEIFRAYDIRGVVGQSLTDEVMQLLGKAIGTEVLDAGGKAVYVGRDGRLSGPQLSAALIQGITSTGCNVMDLGMVPTPLVYFAAATTQVKSGISMTGSHNPPDYNGLKIVINGETLAEQRIQSLRARIMGRDFRSGNGKAETFDIATKYLNHIRDDIVLARPMKVVVDCGNGVAGATAPQLLKSLGCEVVPLFCDVDGHFPNHHPDPSKPENLRDLIARVAAENADIGLAFDGDGDRLGVVTPKGEVIWPDRLMMLYARDVLMRSPGADILFDVKCTRDLASVISQAGGRPVMWRTGHSLIKAKLKETKALLAGEMSGHIFFNDRWFGFDDAMYSAARLLEILSLEVAPVDEVFAEFPLNVSTPELHISVTEAAKFRLVDALQKQGQFGDGNVNTIDGVRVDYPDSWGLVRASNTTPVLVCRFEGRTADDLEKVQDIFREQLLKIDSNLRIPF